MNKYGRNVLHCAAENTNSSENLEYLLQNGMESLIESRDKQGNTPLILASYSGTLDNVKLLLNAKADWK